MAIHNGSLVFNGTNLDLSSKHKSNLTAYYNLLLSLCLVADRVSQISWCQTDVQSVDQSQNKN